MKQTPEQSADTSKEDILALFALQHASDNLQRLKETTVIERIRKIERVVQYLSDPVYQKDWIAALENDLGKSSGEAKITELSPLLANVKHIKRNLRKWMADRRTDSPPVMLGMRSYIRYEPKGHVLIIAPWNYPLFLVLEPLIFAIAAGNAAMVKPSEFAPATSAFLRQMLSSLFDQSEVALVEGAVETSTTLLEQPFHHIFFTGSTKVGKIVMEAAAKNLTSVTLELGGKSPVIIDRKVKMKSVAEKVAWAKCINAGQTCIAPDYIVVHEADAQAFTQQFSDAVQRFYNRDGKGVTTAGDYGRIITHDHYARLRGLVEDAVAQGAVVSVEGTVDDAHRLMTPFVLTEVTPEMQIMQEEIFGPVLPVITYKSFSDVPEIVSKWPRPLALYVMSTSKRNAEFILRNTASGGVGINELLVTIINPALPFGGVNQSGIGKSLGRHGFIEFSNERGVVKRKWLDFKMIYPPLNKTIIDWLLRLSKL